MSSKRKKFNNSYETNNKIKNKIGNGNRNRNRNSNRNRNRYGSMEKILSSLVMEMEDNDESEKNKILAQQIEAFKQEFDEDDYDNDYEGDRSNYNINEDFNKNQNTKKSRRLTLEFFLKLNIKKELSLKKKSIKNDMYNGKGDKATFKCPYCKYEYYDKIEESVHQELQHFLEVNHMKKDGKIISFNIPVMKQYEYCRLHQAKLVIIPQGLKKGYPLEINFDLLQERIERFKKDLFEIVYDRKKSYFRELALNEYKRYGSNKARNFSFLIQRFDKILVGYYGSKGFNIITEILLNMFFIKRKENELAKPFEYIQEVLVPECGVRLIAEDQHLNIDNKEDMEKARKIMEESNEFGLVVHEF
ncbi:RTC4-like domain-containing protein [Neocallimastix sp. 'constans']